MQQRIQPTSEGPGNTRRARVLIEDGRLELTAVDFAAARTVGVDLAICSGPADMTDSCRLVTDGVCPLGRPDAVVCGLGGEWRQSIEAAWRLEGVPVTPVDPDEPLPWPTHLGVAIAAALGAATYGAGI